MTLAKESGYTIEDVLSLPDGERAELIDGQMYMMSSPGYRRQRLVGRAYLEISNYIEGRGGKCIPMLSPFAVFLADETDYVEPDLLVVCDPSKLDEKGCHGAPDWVMEVVSPSSRRLDYFIKLFKYRAEGVREYWIVDPLKERVMVYRFSPDEDKEDVDVYSLKDTVPVGVFDDLEIRFEE